MLFTIEKDNGIIILSFYNSFKGSFFRRVLLIPGYGLSWRGYLFFGEAFFWPCNSVWESGIRSNKIHTRLSNPWNLILACQELYLPRYKSRKSTDFFRRIHQADWFWPRETVSIGINLHFQGGNSSILSSWSSFWASMRQRSRFMGPWCPSIRTG